MKWIRNSIYIFSVVVVIVACGVASPAPIISLTVTVVPSLTPIDPTPMKIQPTLTPIPAQIVFPSITMSPQENEKALLELLKTNGNCTSKCIGGVYPDKMSVQEAVNVMSQWGMVAINKNSVDQTYIGLKPITLYGQLIVSLALGTWTKELESIDKLVLELHGSGSYYVNKKVWQANQGALQGFRMDNILKTYGIPSYVGYDFSSISAAQMPEKGDSVEYGMSLHFEQINLHMLLSGIAYYDGTDIFLCPSKETHALYLEINPERPLKELQNVFPVTWQALTGTDLNAFYQTFTSGKVFDACVTTDLGQILTLQPSR